jgi:hypothetical protein
MPAIDGNFVGNVEMSNIKYYQRPSLFIYITMRKLVRIRGYD